MQAREGRLLGRNVLALVAAAADQIEERGGELVGAGVASLAGERRDERGRQIRGRLLLVTALVADLRLMAEAGVNGGDNGQARRKSEQ